MSASSARAANSAGAGRADGSGVPGASVVGGAGGPGSAVPGLVTISPSGATGRSAAGAPLELGGADVAAGGGAKTSVVTVSLAHPATIAAGTSIETASARTRWLIMIPPGFGCLLRSASHTIELIARAPAPTDGAVLARERRPRPGDGRSRIGPRRGPC